MSFFQKLFIKKKMENQDLLEKLLTTSKDFQINKIIIPAGLAGILERKSIILFHSNKVYENSLNF